MNNNDKICLKFFDISSDSSWIRILKFGILKTGSWIRPKIVWIRNTGINTCICRNNIITKKYGIPFLHFQIITNILFITKSKFPYAPRETANPP